MADEADTSGAIEFLDRMSWLPKLLAELDDQSQALEQVKFGPCVGSDRRASYVFY